MQTVLPAHRLVANTSHVNYVGVEYNKDKKGIRDGPSVHSIKGKMSGCYCVDNQKDGECDTWHNCNADPSQESTFFSL